jgi:hypothetical protein
VGKSTSVENGLRLAKFLIDAPIIAHVFLGLAVPEGMEPTVIGGCEGQEVSPPPIRQL